VEVFGITVVVSSLFESCLVVTSFVVVLADEVVSSVDS